MPEPPPAAPTHLLRTHTSPITILAFSDDNERLYSGDASGRVVVTSTRSIRALSVWNPHEDALLGIEEWGGHIITHGRDNKLHVWTRVEELPASVRVGGAATALDLPSPKLCYSMDVNALNYCRFSLLRLHSDTDEPKALIALPNLIDSSVADVWSLPGRDRVHASIGEEIAKSIFSSDPGGRNNSGIIMSLHLFFVLREASSTYDLRILCAYENGGLTLRRYDRADKEKSVQGTGWEVLWTRKSHVEAIMAMRVSRANDFALTVSADHIIGRYNLSRNADAEEPVAVPFKTKHAGNSALAIRDDGKVCAVGGWDGKIRLYSTRSFKPLGALKYHKSNCQAIEFARSLNENLDDKTELFEYNDEEMNEQERAERARWLVGGSKDNRVSIWTLISFDKA
ncbi:WD-40 repeat-containing protein [Crucibulum laeve]|uniref:ASTRA-associated protein 1 n=1 Tax=Crucibulum laeve TaxID=68775 RepID=A0A5C3M4Q8_9AGAR|nr:WD-40 repeat-containing protein [Crucibulum laeve]